MFGATDSGTSAAARVVDVACAAWRAAAAASSEDAHRVAGLERQRPVFAGFDPPQRDQLLELLRVFLGQVVDTRSGRSRVLNNSQRWLAKSPHAPGAAGVTDAAFQPSW